MELETDMETDPTDFIHLYHCFWPRRAALLGLLQRFDFDPAAIRSAGRDRLASAGVDAATVRRIHAPLSATARGDLAWLAADESNHLISCCDADFPALLKQIGDFPLLLYARGNPGLLPMPQVAIVGSRHCTPGGVQNAIDFAAALARGGLTITSGMALGIDSAAHRGALDANGQTVAVIGTGIDRVYPARNRRLAAEIAERGLIVSEFPRNSPARPGHFPQRNRIISGLCVATLVIEAARRSGSLITARLAAEQGREVYALPGSIHNPQARGCHRLIGDGAKLAERPVDIVEDLGALLGFVIGEAVAAKSASPVALDSEQQKLLEAIGYDPVNCDILVQRSGLTIEQLSSMLTILELNDLIQSAPGGCFVRI